MIEKQAYRELFALEILRKTWDGIPMDAGTIAVATTTRYDSSPSGRQRAQQAYRTMKKARDSGYSVVCVDGGSPEHFLGKLRELGATVEQERPGTMGSGRRQAIRTAQERGDVVIWTEPEKYPLLDDYSRMATPLIGEEADSIVPFRTAEGLQSYPPQQRMAELAGNLTTASVAGYYLDLWFGPKAWRSGISQYYTEEFEKLAQQLELPDRWDSTIVPALLMVHDGLCVGDITSTYRHPREQTELESKDILFDVKRSRQLEGLTTSIMKVAKHLGM